MVPLSELWLPILVSAVVLQFTSAFIHTALGFWHTPDYWNVEDDRPFIEAMRRLKSGMYIVPRAARIPASRSVRWNDSPGS